MHSQQAAQLSHQMLVRYSKMSQLQRPVTSIASAPKPAIP
ncbi:hypothetical protein FHT43_006844 [Mycolicibacterium sp. BK607]|nr:hypothetical protein [Mycolicibacterium sp. BK607]